jgi:hypothetical protein
MMKGICSVCGHKLASHISEGDGWRCHSIGQDCYQCECFLRRRAESSYRGVIQFIGKDFYDLEKRTQAYAKGEPTEKGKQFGKIEKWLDDLLKRL